MSVCCDNNEIRQRRFHSLYNIEFAFAVATQPAKPDADRSIANSPTQRSLNRKFTAMEQPRTNRWAPKSPKSLAVAKPLQKALLAQGFPQPTPIQAQALRSFLKG